MFLNSSNPDAYGYPLSCSDHVTLDPVPLCAAIHLRLDNNSAPASRVEEEETIIILHVWGRPSDDISPVTLCSNSAARIPGPRRAAAGSERRQGRAPERSAPLRPPGSGGRTQPACPALGQPTRTCTEAQTPQLAPRGARGVAITTGRPPQRPPGRK